jgi:hypothetical protein
MCASPRRIGTWRRRRNDGGEEGEGQSVPLARGLSQLDGHLAGRLDAAEVKQGEGARA